MGTVIYARVTWRGLSVFDDRPTTFSEHGIAVAYRRDARCHWITDWHALRRAQDLSHPRVDLDPFWEDRLSQEDRQYLEMMRFLHPARPAREHFRRRAEILLDGNTAAHLVDEAWIRPVRVTNGEGPAETELWEVIIGSDLSGRKAGNTATFEEARGLAELALGRARDDLAAQLAERGGLAAEMAAHRSSWPEPTIHLVPNPR